MSFYAIVLDWNLQSGGSSVDLIDSGRTLAALRAVTSYDPSADCTTVQRSKFAIDTVEAHPISNSYTGNQNPAHICRVDAK